MLDASRFNAVIIGGGSVAARKAKGLLEGGASVKLVAPEISEDLLGLAATHSRIHLVKRPYAPSDLATASLVVAATDDSAVNASVARDAIERGLLVNVVDDPAAGNFVTPSVHRSGDLTIAISSGRTPAAAAAIRAELARRFDGRYAAAIGALRMLREKLLGEDRREDWQRASRDLVTETFCDDVEQGRVEDRVASWR
jgi:siroheme synthase-like protein